MMIATEMSTTFMTTSEPTETAAEIDAGRAWAQLAARDRTAAFFYAVATTGVFCRVGCASRLPRPENVRYFASAGAARAAGFRACKRCKPEQAGAAGQDTGAIDRVRVYLEAHVERAVPLAELGRLAGLSPFTVQRMFTRQFGVSPLGYQRALRAGRLRTQLKQGASVTDAIYEAGFGSSSRAYEGAQLGMTPARFAQGGAGERIGFAVAETAFGWMCVGATGRGLCWLALAASEAEAAATLHAEFPRAALSPDPALADTVAAALAVVQGVSTGLPVNLDLRGTAFQLRVWQALRAIPRGETRSYGQLAREMGIPSSTRAVARACALNRVSVMVPCHRVVGATGALTGYRWGVERKREMLRVERLL